MHQDYYIYIHRRISDGAIFYVGKGRGRRAYSRNNRSAYWKRVADKHGHTVEIVQRGMEEIDAYDAEIALIAKLRKDGAPLVNLTDGGQAPNGYVSKMKIGVYCSNGMYFASHSEAVEWLRVNGHPYANVSSIAEASLKGYRAHDLKWDRNSTPDFKLLVCSNGETFVTCCEASKFLNSKGLNASSVTISKAANGSLKTAYGLRWGWGEVQPVVAKAKPGVIRSDGTRYKSLKLAAHDVGGCRLKISRACRFGTEEYGYTWRTE